MGNFQQENLVNKLTNCTFSAHDAKEDVRALTVLFAERLEKEVQDEDLFHIRCEKEIFRIITTKEHQSCSCTKVSKKWYYAISLAASSW